VALAATIWRDCLGYLGKFALVALGDGAANWVPIKSKPTTPQPTPEDIKKLVLEEDDFGHEMRVANVFAELPTKIGLGTNTYFEPLERGSSYKDPLAKKTRQPGFRFRINCTQLNTHAGVFLAVECKNLHKDFPLVVSGRNRAYDESYYHFLDGTYDDLGNVSAVVRVVAGGGHLYEQNQFVGKNFVRIKEGNGRLEAANDSDLFDKWTQVEASCVELLKKAWFSVNPNIRKCRSIILPLVAVPDGSLWMVGYNSKGEIHSGPKQIEECEFFIGKELDAAVQPFRLSHLHFVTLKGFAQLLRRFGTLANPFEWERYFPNASPVYSPG